MTRNETNRSLLLDSLPAEVKMALRLGELKQIVRQNPLSSGDRKELVGEHSWHVALAVILLSDYSSDPIDVGRAAVLATIHDVVEVFVGDTFAFGSEVGTKEAREHAAMDKLRASSQSPAITHLVDLWDEYEAQETPEARFVKGIDALLPIIMNFQNIENSSWRDHGVSAAQVHNRLSRVRGHLGVLGDICAAMIDQAQEDGDLG